jgi:DNA-binding transcriptional ArsR family regulator
MLRIYFTTDDVARTRLAPGPDPLWELVMSVHMLRRQPGDLLFAQWRQATGPAIRRAALGDRLRLLLALTPTAGYFPDFLNPSAAAQGLQHGLEAIRETPKSALAHDIRQLARSRALPDGVQHLASGQPAMLAELTDTMQTCYDLTVAPYRRTVETAVERDRQYRARALADGGVEGLLASFRPTMQWDAGELRIPSHRDQELHLCGRGLLFIPSYFCINGPITMFDPSLPPVVVYSVAKQADTLAVSPGALGALIGVTRAVVLEAICGQPTTTTDLARRLGISASTASEHTTVLRRAGLVTSYRDGNRVVHHPTILGLTLLEFRPGPNDLGHH